MAGSGNGRLTGEACRTTPAAGRGGLAEKEHCREGTGRQRGCPETARRAQWRTAICHTGHGKRTVEAETGESYRRRSSEVRRCWCRAKQPSRLPGRARWWWRSRLPRCCFLTPRSGAARLVPGSRRRRPTSPAVVWPEGACPRGGRGAQEPSGPVGSSCWRASHRCRPREAEARPRRAAGCGRRSRLLAIRLARAGPRPHRRSRGGHGLRPRGRGDRPDRVRGHGTRRPVLFLRHAGRRVFASWRSVARPSASGSNRQ
jgi:hypothetical protein